MKTIKRKIKFIVERTKTGFSAFAEQYPIFTTGKTIPELINNCLEATSLHFEDRSIEVTTDNLKLEIDFQQFFQFYGILNARVLAERIGMNKTLLSQYVQGKKKPSPKQTEKILSGIRQIGKELTEIELIYNR